MPLTPQDILGSSGRIAARLPNYEARVEQMEMADAVARAIELGEHLVVEAGTGVGKSFAYLVPAILAASDARQADDAANSPEGSRSIASLAARLADKSPPRERCRVVISTHTISLQEQLISKDVPFLNAVMPVEFSAVLVKGRSNYVSLRRLHQAWEKVASLFDRNEQEEQLQKLKQWSLNTRDGSLADVDFRPFSEVWDEVKSEHGNCLGKNCPKHVDCHYFKARRRVWNADLLIVNHALFFSDLALRRIGASVLPDYDVAIFDEAHTLEDVAGAHLGLTLTSGQFMYLFSRLYNDRTQRGLLMQHSLIEAQRMTAGLRSTVSDFFQDVNYYRADRASKNGRLREPPPLENRVSPKMRELSTVIRDYAAGLDKMPAQQIELTAAADRVDGLAHGLDDWLSQRSPDSVHWIEQTGGRIPNTQLISAPIDVGTALREQLFSQVRTVILTSATLAVGESDFSYFRDRVGLTKAAEVKLGSPFNYPEQVTLVLAADIPDPTVEPVPFENAIVERIKRHVEATDGGAFVLFTSYKMLKNCADRLAGWFREQNMQLLTQGEGVNRTQLLDRFKQDGRAVLFGADTFWQGVDVPGDALRNVIITKLPFSVPDHPLLEARVERIRERGGNPFMEYQVPEAAIKLRQAFGRLIRNRTDTGRVVILDPRIRTKHYGRLFLASLPECRRVIDHK